MKRILFGFGVVLVLLFGQALAQTYVLDQVLAGDGQPPAVAPTVTLAGRDIVIDNLPPSGGEVYLTIKEGVNLSIQQVIVLGRTIRPVATVTRGDFRSPVGTCSNWRVTTSQERVVIKATKTDPLSPLAILPVVAKLAGTVSQNLSTTQLVPSGTDCGGGGGQVVWLGPTLCSQILPSIGLTSFFPQGDCNTGDIMVYWETSGGNGPVSVNLYAKKVYQYYDHVTGAYQWGEEGTLTFIGTYSSSVGEGGVFIKGGEVPFGSTFYLFEVGAGGHEIYVGKVGIEMCPT